MNAKVTILLVEDNPDDALFIDAVLSEATGVTADFELVCVQRLSEGLACLAEGGFDLVLLDLSLPDSQGLDTFHRVHSEIPHLPVVVLSGLDDEAFAIKAVREGAQDYLVKGRIVEGDGSLLVRAIRYAIERARTENALRESEQRFRRLVEQAADAFFVLDEQGRIIDVNHRACESLDYTREELLSLSLADIEDGLVPEGFADLWEHMPADAPITLDGLHRRKDGTAFPVESRFGWFELGGHKYILVLVRDATERRWAEEALRQYAAELEARNEDLDAFAHTAAHDLKGPLGPVVGLAHALEQDYAELPDEDVRRYLRIIAQKGHKMGNIIDELLLLAGVRKIKDLEMEALEMGHIVAESLERQEYLAEACRAEIILPESWPVAMGYGPWVEEVWVNYLNNALKYGGRPPRVELGSTLQADGMVRFWMRDNGPGLTDEEQARLFRPFERLDRVRAKGYGLGLSIVRRIVERLGGEVGVESQVDQGSVFSFTLPVERINHTGDSAVEG